MSHQDNLIAEDILAYLEAQRNKSYLRCLTCGSVDDGKSTLIGRLLFDSKMIYEDQLSALENDSKKSGTQGEKIDLALLVDGLAAEREQGITIDVAYRFFSTDKRKFIIADTPGHIQYTRNMATGASTADLAIILIDARRGVLDQTRRHSYIASLLGIRNIVVAVNKMDLVEFSQHKFNEIEEEYRGFAEKLDFKEIVCIPMSALDGDNVMNRSERCKWYKGKSLMEHLETVDISQEVTQTSFRMPVQWVNRPNLDFRGYSGTIAAGQVKPGDEIIVIPSGKRSVVDKIVIRDGDLYQAEVNESVTITLRDEIDISRGDIICSTDDPAEQSDQFQANIIWMDEEAMFPGRQYIMKINNQTVPATVTDLKYKVNVNNFAHEAGKSLALNEVGVCNLSLGKPIPFDSYKKNRHTGAFILIDRQTNATIGAGMLDYSLRRAANVVWQDLEVGKVERANLKHQKPAVLWFTGLSGSGKSTIAGLLEKKLFDIGRHTYVLDGDNVRHGLNKDLGFTDADRVENIRRVAETSRLMVEAGLMVMVSFISPFRSERQMARNLMEDGEFIEVFVNTPLDVAEQRDVKGLYKKAREGKIKNFTGIDSPYEAPENPDIVVDTVDKTPEKAVEQILAYLEENGYLSAS
ncbi:sulfate adenylyltransferase subunit CysN [Parvularcula flava]|uniref:Multifunctional fusion protein n=1 Tax=Aquisalinus luteolus TaxID=1566827 RepID=A0A8J3EPV1_9PROT|nr:sulfate adenylyltransferase subunit CysN [Aquisalinus luteolus]NHK28898.1 sulfate adenylyltransferase subunit CysN [Aquisalinus luteolus]GGH99849.1 adenylyl-sulfate kinase [Aquisalinus luteolus]